MSFRCDAAKLDARPSSPQRCANESHRPYPPCGLLPKCKKPVPAKGRVNPWCHPFSPPGPRPDDLSQARRSVCWLLNAPGVDNGALSGQAYNRVIRVRLAAPRSILPPRQYRLPAYPALWTSLGGLLLLFAAFVSMSFRPSIGVSLEACQLPAHVLHPPAHAPLHSSNLLLASDSRRSSTWRRGRRRCWPRVAVSPQVTPGGRERQPRRGSPRWGSRPGGRLLRRPSHCPGSASRTTPRRRAS